MGVYSEIELAEAMEGFEGSCTSSKDDVHQAMRALTALKVQQGTICGEEEGGIGISTWISEVEADGVATRREVRDKMASQR